MKTLLWINTVIEVLAGLLFLFFPGLPEFLPGWTEAGDELITLLVKMYGVAALILGVFSGFLLFRLKYIQVVLIDGLALFTFFHAGIAGILFIYSPDIRPGILHGTLGLAFLFFWIKTR